jgi:antitoxin Phd
VEKALTEGPQHVTRNGRPAVVVVPEAEWLRVSARGRSVVDVLLDPSVRGILTPEEASLFERDRDSGRPPPKF